MLTILNPLTLSRDEARKLDYRAIHEFGIPSRVLMENAGRSIVEYLLSFNVQGKVVICCGKGNNGGDGLVVARYLHDRNILVKTLLFSDPEQLSADAKINFQLAIKSGVFISTVNEKNSDSMIAETLTDAEWIVDGLFGTGLI